MLMECVIIFTMFNDQNTHYAQKSLFMSRNLKHWTSATVMDGLGEIIFYGSQLIIRLDIKYQPPEGAFTDWMDENFSVRKQGSREALLGDPDEWQLGRPMTTSSTSGFLTPTLSRKDLKGSKRSLASGGTTRRYDWVLVLRVHPHHKRNLCS